VRSPGDAELPLVSVVTPSYNQGRFIAATIESVLSQDYSNIEYIVVDGASNDDTAEVVARYGDRLRFVSEPDRGQSDAINKGFRMARGEIVAWLNSDDVFLPGAVSAAVAALTDRPDAGAVYGEGYQMDEAGNITSRFAVTQEFNLWRLLNLSDYILQQSVFFRRRVFDEIGFLDESLHYGMDWEILMRIGLHYPIQYIPHEMGAIREYPSAKSFSGGSARARELAAIMRRHTGKHFPPGMFVYGLPTYAEIVNRQLEHHAAGPMRPLVRRLQRRTTWAVHRIVGRILREAQGWYTDDWAAPHARFTFPPSRGRNLAIDVELPSWVPFERQRLSFSVGRRVFARETFAAGRFTIPLIPPRATWNAPVTIDVRAERWFRPPLQPAQPPDRRRLAYFIRSFEFEDRPRGAEPVSRSS
jgi:glycosyltransferase involved in cell wall biosynthesis